MEQHDHEASGEDEAFTFHCVIDQKGPLKTCDAKHNGPRHNVKIEWEDTGAMPWEPLTVIGKCDLATCAVHAKEHGLLNEPGWKQFKKCTPEAKTLQHLVNDAEWVQKFGQIVHKFGVCISQNKKEALALKCKNANAHWQISCLNTMFSGT